MPVAKDVFVTPAWLAEHLGDAGVIAVEASFYLPDEGKDADALFRAAHIPGATRFDVDAIADRTIPLPHMLPTAETFATMVGGIGINEKMTIVIYDATDLLGGARAWWMLTRYGAANVHILKGGWKTWLAGGFPVEAGESRREPTTFVVRLDASQVVDAAAVLDATTSGPDQIVDARAAGRFAGAVPEPRAGLRSGHVPGARNVSWRDVLAADGTMKPSAEIAATFAQAGVDLDKPIITSCGSGVSAAVLILALEQAGKSGAKLYDGSWSEWGGRHDLPIETGPAQP